MTPSTPKRRHKWANEQQRGATCVRCGLYRLRQRGEVLTWLYAWPSGTKATYRDSDPVPPCQPLKEKP